MENAAKIVDMVVKVAAAIAGVVVVLIASHFQESMNAVNLQTQREQADSSLRASMFSNLINPIVKPGEAKEVDINRERLLVEILALNFNETLSLKPLMVDVDKRLTQKFKTEMNHAQGRHLEQTETVWSPRESLRSSAQLVAQKQLAMLTKKDADLPQSKDQTCIYRIELSMADKEKKESLPTVDAEKEQSSLASKPLPCFSTISRFFGSLIEVQSLDNRYTLLFQIYPETWEDQNFRVVVTIDSKENTKTFIPKTREDQNNAPAPTAVPAVEFLLTWFDFPLTNNTFLADGTRFAFIIDRVEEEKQRANFSLIWFNKDFFSSRERPINYTKVRDKLGLK